MMTLHQFLFEQERVFRWGGMGGDDCMTGAASWIRERTGIDVIPHLRGAYQDADGANLIVERAGGLVALASNLLETRGFARTHRPVDGDVAVIRTMAGFDIDGAYVKEVAAIRFGPLWAAMSPLGFRAKRADLIAAWSIAP